MIPLPEDFEKRVQQDPFLNATILESLNSTAPVSVRLNLNKTHPDLAFSENVPWCNGGFYLEKRPVFTLDPLFHAGCYYPQEAGSMVLDEVFKQLDLPSEPKFLDLCAAPGGKSTLIASFLEGKGLLVANEFVHSRAMILKENLTKWGVSNVIVTNNKPADFDQLPHFFDVVLADVPCSGEGMFRKDPESRKEWSLKNVHMCALRQQQIIEDSWNALAPGGYLIYSTCTLNADENESNVKWISNTYNAEIVQLKIDESFKKGRDGVGYYAIPGITKSEGFFIAVLKKGDESPQKMKKISFSDWKPYKDMDAINAICNENANCFFHWKDFILTFPQSISESLHQILGSKLYVIKTGTTLGSIVGKKIIPSEELALNPYLRLNNQSIEFTLEQASHYLKGETFNLPSHRGYILVNFQNEPLGWINHLGNRFNNMYPKEWRIRMKIN